MHNLTFGAWKAKKIESLPQKNNKNFLHNNEESGRVRRA